MHRQSERGAAAVEFALLLPLIVIILFATIEFGLAFAKWEDYESAAREGARYAAVTCQPRRAGDAAAPSPCTVAMVWRAVKEASSNFSANPTMPADFGVSQLDCANNAGDSVTVSWTQLFTVDVPLVQTYQLQRQIKGVFRCEL